MFEPNTFGGVGKKSCLYTVVRIAIRYNRVWVMVLNFLN